MLLKTVQLRAIEFKAMNPSQKAGNVIKDTVNKTIGLIIPSQVTRPYPAAEGGFILGAGIFKLLLNRDEPDCGAFIHLCKLGIGGFRTAMYVFDAIKYCNDPFKAELPTIG